MGGTTEATQDPRGDNKSNHNGFLLLLALQVVSLLCFSFVGYNQRVKLKHISKSIDRHYERIAWHDERIAQYDERIAQHDDRFDRQDDLHLNTHKHIQSTTERFDWQDQRQDELHGEAEGRIRKLENLLQASHARIQELEQHVHSTDEKKSDARAMA